MVKNKEHFPPKISEYNIPINKGYIKGKYGYMGFSHYSFYVVQIPVQQARNVIKTQHYSKKIVNNSYIHLGVYIQGQLQGVLQFGYLKNPSCAGSIVKGTGNKQCLELNRMWFSDKAPKNSESNAISYSIKYIKEVCKQVRWIQSFADERCKLYGVTYQAANFMYLGYHETVFYKLDNEIYHNMQMTRKNGGNKSRYLQANKERAKKT